MTVTHNDKMMLGSVSNKISGLVDRLVAERVAVVQRESEEQVSKVSSLMNTYFTEKNALGSKNAKLKSLLERVLNGDEVGEEIRAMLTSSEA